MEVKRLRTEDHELARDAVRRLKTQKALACPDADYFRKFLSCPENVLIVAVEGATPVSFLLAYIFDRLDRDQRMIFFYEIGVAEPDRRQGIGRAMVEALKGLCQQEHAMKMWVLTNRSNIPAVRLYESTGGVADPSGDEVSFRFLYASDVFA